MKRDTLGENPHRTASMYVYTHKITHTPHLGPFPSVRSTAILSLLLPSNTVKGEKKQEENLLQQFSKPKSDGVPFGCHHSMVFVITGHHHVCPSDFTRLHRAHLNATLNVGQQTCYCIRLVQK